MNSLTQTPPTRNSAGAQLSGMDFPRKVAGHKYRNRILYTVAAIIGVGTVSVVLGRLEPAVPAISKSSLWVSMVKRGPMLRQVRGTGALVPEQIQYLQTETDGRVDKINVLPGTEVKADSVIVELSNPELEQTEFDLEWQIRASGAQYTNLQVKLESDRLAQEAAVVALKLDCTQSQLEADADEELAGSGLVASLAAKRSRAKATELLERLDIERKRLVMSQNSAAAQLTVQQADLEKLRAVAKLKHRQVESLKVRAGIDGVIIQIGDKEALQIGQRVTPSTILAKIVHPSRLKAEVKIPEVLAKDVQVGQLASIDTRNGMVSGQVARVDPAVQNGTVTVDFKIDGALPKGARPDLSIDGTIELERLSDVLYVDRPVNGQPETILSVFKLVENGKSALRVKVQFGRISTATIEILEGLQVGDQLIVSDMSMWDGHSRLRVE